MHSERTSQVLNQLWVIHNYSLPTYLAQAPPWWNGGNGSAALLLQDVVRDQQQLADRLGKLLIKYAGQVTPGKYPGRFTDLHDLSSRFMWDEMLRYQQRTVDTIETLTSQLPPSSVAQALAQECLGVAKAHLDSMREVAVSGNR